MLLNSDKKFTKNYFNNPRAENGVYSWNLYNDGAATRPVNGTGGVASGNFSVTTSASAPIEGARSLHLVKAAANMQGYGFSTDMAIDLGLQGKMTQVRFDYRIVAGTFSGSGVNTVDSDLIVYFYDVTNSALIEPSCIVMDGVNTGLTFTFKANVQIPTSCASLRFIVHQSKDTSATGYTLDFDNFSLSEQIAVQGAPVSDWISWTPTISWTSGITSKAGTWRRVGDSAEYSVNIVCSGAVTSSALTLTLPDGHVIDSAKCNAVALYNYGQVRIFDDNTAVQYFGNIGYTDVNILNVKYLDASANPQSVTQAAPITFAASDIVAITVKVPILGWSTSTSVSGVDSSDGRLVAATAWRGVPSQTITAGPWIELVFDNKGVDTHSFYSTSTGRATLPVSGTYKVNYTITIYSNSATPTVYQARVQKNSTGTMYAWAYMTDIVVDKYYTISGSAIIQGNAGDYISAWAQSTTQDGAMLGGSSTEAISSMTIERLPSTTSISSGETVAFLGFNTAGTNISSETVIPWTTTKDTHGGMSAGVYTCQIAGLYSVSGAIWINGASDTDDYLYIRAYKNSSIVCSVYSYTSGSNIASAALPNVLISCVAGDTISIKGRTSCSTVTLGTESGTNVVEIIRVGS